MKRKDTKPAMDKLVGDVIVPELEKLIGIGLKAPWNEHDESVLRRYFGKVAVSNIAKTLNRSLPGVNSKASSLGLRNSHV
jgi:hypothetical protein